MNIEKESSIGDPSLWRTICIAEGEIPIGRASEKHAERAAKKSNMLILNTHLSKTHAKLSIVNKTLYLEDLSSTFGTTWNDHLLVPHKRVAIKEGDHIGFVLNRPTNKVKEWIEKAGESEKMISMDKIFNPSVQLIFKVQTYDPSEGSLVLSPSKGMNYLKLPLKKDKVKEISGNSDLKIRTENGDKLHSMVSQMESISDSDESVADSDSPPIEEPYAREFFRNKDPQPLFLRSQTSEVREKQHLTSCPQDTLVEVTAGKDSKPSPGVIQDLSYDLSDSEIEVVRVSTTHNEKEKPASTDQAEEAKIFSNRMLLGKTSDAKGEDPAQYHSFPEIKCTDAAESGALKKSFSVTVVDERVDPEIFSKESYSAGTIESDHDKPSPLSEENKVMLSVDEEVGSIDEYNSESSSESEGSEHDSCNSYLDESHSVLDEDPNSAPEFDYNMIASEYSSEDETWSSQSSQSDAESDFESNVESLQEAEPVASKRSTNSYVDSNKPGNHWKKQAEFGKKSENYRIVGPTLDVIKDSSEDDALNSQYARKRSHDSSELVEDGHLDSQMNPEAPSSKRARTTSVAREISKGLLYVTGTLVALVAYGGYLEKSAAQ